LSSCSSQSSTTTVDSSTRTVNGYQLQPKAELAHAALSGQDLSGVILVRANLSRANLAGVNLYGANLHWTNLEHANLVGAYLQGAHLKGAILRGANLSAANLFGADLRGADLRGANLAGADLRDTYLRDASFKDAELTGAILPCWDYPQTNNIDPKVVSAQPICDVETTTVRTIPSPPSTVRSSWPLCLNQKTTKYWDPNMFNGSGGYRTEYTCG